MYAAYREFHLKDDYKEAAFLMAMKLHFLAKEITICLERLSCFVLDGHGIHRYQSAKVSVFRLRQNLSLTHNTVERRST